MLQLTNCKRSSLFQPVSLHSQVAKALEPIATAPDIKTVTLTGGVDIGSQQQQLLEKPQLVIATPGRLLAVIQENKLSAKPMRNVVLDEADRLLDMGLAGYSNHFIFCSSQKASETLLFSATLPKELVSQAEALLINPVRSRRIKRTVSFDPLKKRST